MKITAYTATHEGLKVILLQQNGLTYSFLHDPVVGICGSKEGFAKMMQDYERNLAIRFLPAGVVEDFKNIVEFTF